jgi:hypothetical protein
LVKNARLTAGVLVSRRRARQPGTKDIHLMPSDRDGPSFEGTVQRRWTEDMWSFHDDPRIDVAVASLQPLEDRLMMKNRLFSRGSERKIFQESGFVRRISSSRCYANRN